MNLVIALSLVFLMSPVFGYLVISLDLSPRAKFAIALVGIFILTMFPVLVVLLAGGSGGG